MNPVTGLVSILGGIAAIAVAAEVLSWAIGNNHRAAKRSYTVGTSGKPANGSKSNDGSGQAAAMSQESPIPVHTPYASRW
jgi:hypothetical protein